MSDELGGMMPNDDGVPMRLTEHPWFLGMDRAAQSMRIFRDRVDAGVRLAERLSAYRGRNALVLGLVRGGVPVAAEVAKALDADLDVLVARKLGAPTSPELAIGAVTADGGRYLNQSLIDELAISSTYIERITQAEMALAQRQEQRFREGPPPNVSVRTVILVDDGLATGATMIAAARALRAKHPARLVVAVPLGAAESCEELRQEADEVICDIMPKPFWAVGLHYQDFSQVDDAEVERLLRDAHSVRH